ncbi:MAG: PhzF family phenazine biosynthesis protein [Armatimonadetes bacterium]|nr:PhzF family phenazine biosynthesis protein [Armatimonadota bacterium]
MQCEFSLVDAFITDDPFSGNPAGVCWLESWPEDEVLQAFAAEMNQAETAFMVDEGEQIRLRWFTPTVEVDLCGHATLASTLVVWGTRKREEDSPIRFITKSGELVAIPADAGYTILDFPGDPSEETNSQEIIDLAPNGIHYAVSRRKAMIVLPSVEDVRNYQPDFDQLSKIEKVGVIITAKQSEDTFVSRFFAPQSGVPEDSVTGSAHCVLAPYWSEQLGRPILNAHQLSNRGGFLRTQIQGDRVFLAGRTMPRLVGTAFLG